MKKLFLLALACLALTGCTTAWLLNSGITDTDTKTEQDKITAFGVVQNTQQLVMLGEKYAFLFEESDSKKLVPILTAELPKPFQVVKSETDLTLTGLSVKFFGDRGRFSAETTLAYLPQNAAETAKLKKLGFTQAKQDKRYIQSVSVSGNVYQSETLNLSQKRFETPLPLTIYSDVTSTNWKVLALPATVAVDIVTLPIMLPLTLMAIGTISP